MKRLLIIACILCAELICPAQSISSLWNGYEEARRSDKPQKQLEILEKIGKSAESKRLHWDFYRYWNEKVNTVSSINWKLRDSVCKARERALTQYNEPVVSVSSAYLWSNSALRKKFIAENAGILRKGKNREFWKMLPDARHRCVANDYEYAVWNCAAEDTAMLRGMLLERHSKEAVDLMYGKSAIEAAFDSLMMHGGQGADFSKLYDRCLGFNSSNRRFSAEDALLAECFSVEGIIDELTGSRISVNPRSGESGTIDVTVRNIGGIVFQLRDGERMVFETVVSNPRNSFYAWDTIPVPVPEIDDGDYELVCRNASDSDMCAVSRFQKRSISLVCVADDGGWSVFACDSRTRKPLEKVELTVRLKGGTLKSLASGFDAMGFVPIPQETAQKMAQEMAKKRVVQIVAGSTSEKGTRMLSLPVMIPQLKDAGEEICSESFFLDRPYYSLGDTVRFKVLAYKQKLGEKPEIRPSGKLDLVLRSPEGELTGSCTVTLNDFGTGEGRMTIQGKSNGIWRICEETGPEHYVRQCATFRVEDPVLSGYDLDFDDEGKIFRPGDTIKVSGTLKRLDGQNVQGAELSYRIGRNYSDGPLLESGTIGADANGRFAFKFKSDESVSYYSIKVAVTDGTGETDEFTTGRQCSPARFSVDFINPERGYLALGDQGESFIVSGRGAAVRFSSPFSGMNINYKLLSGTRSVCEGSCMSGDTVRLDLEGYPDGIFTLTAATVGERKEYSRKYSFLKTSGNAESLCPGVGLLIMPTGNRSLKIGSSTDECMACIILSDDSGKTIGTETAHIGPAHGKESLLKEIRFEGVTAEPFKADVIVFNKKGRTQRKFDFNGKKEILPLSFKNLTAELHPRETGRITLGTEPGTEAVIAVYDKAMDSFNGSRYAAPVFMRTTKNAKFNFEAGGNKLIGATMVRAMSKSAMAGVYEEMAESVVYEEEAIPFSLTNDAYGMGADGGGIRNIIRTDFSRALAFIPFARADENGEISFEVTASDRTSTFLVDVFAHNKELKCAVIDTEILVKVPVQITVNEPRFLRSGDSLTVNGTIFNSTAMDICDTLCTGTVRRPFSVPAGGSADFRYVLQVPGDASTATVSASFSTDAIVKEIPVIKGSQTITEAHSAVLHGDADRDSVHTALASQFVNFASSELSGKEIKILDMLHEALPEQVDTSSRNAISISGSILSAQLAEIENLASTRAELRSRLAACRNADGGFGWMPGMKSSPVVTAVVLERLARCSGFTTLSYPAAAYLDSVFIRTYGDRTKFFRTIPLPQYLYVRSMYPQVGFNSAGADGKTLKELRKEVKKFLTPGSGRGLQGEILTKTRRALTLRNLASSSEGVLLAEAMGVKALTRRQLEKSERKDIASLREYAVKHPSGGTYFPNAVMPWRGLLESELYAHTLLHRALGDNDICLWMMLQKETQKWSSDPACVDAVAETLTGGETVLNTKVLALRASREMPLEEIRATGNGMSIKREILRGGKPLAEGDTLHTGERITVRCTAKSDENRSFVVLKAPHAASIRPINQKSGFDWNTGAYRNVTPEANEYWFDVFPEEGFTFSEDFFVVQEGCFASGVCTVVSLYADHYRANDENCYLCSLNDK